MIEVEDLDLRVRWVEDEIHTRQKTDQSQLCTESVHPNYMYNTKCNPKSHGYVLFGRRAPRLLQGLKSWSAIH